jgi:hypothetical protein
MGRGDRVSCHPWALPGSAAVPYLVASLFRHGAGIVLRREHADA